MSRAKIARNFGSNVRVTILNAHTVNPDNYIDPIITRMAYDLATTAKDILGQERATEIMYRAADALITDSGPPFISEPVEVEEPAPGPVAAPASPLKRMWRAADFGLYGLGAILVLVGLYMAFNK